MCCGKDQCDCEVKVTELENGYQIQLTGDKVKEILKAEDLEKCVQSCCQGKSCCE